MMNSSLFWKPCPPGQNYQVIYQSEAILEENGSSYDAVLTHDSIRFNQMCLPYNFDLKFGIRDGGIYFEQDQKVMEFKLPRHDEKKWRDILKLHLNQKGFHEAFKAIKKIGKGNFASVYLVQKLQNKQKFAVKAFSKEAAYSEQNGKQCLIKEIEIMRHLNHPNLMKLEQVYQSDNSLYIIFQLLDGGQLYDKIKSKYQFSPAETNRMMKGLLQGLKEMHEKDIMHRDLKPENILIRGQGSLDLVIADFGLSQFSHFDEYLFVRCGTPGYVAPQVINIKDMKKKYSTICDIFSAGIIFHVFLFGKSIFRSKTYNEVLAQNRACSYTFDAQMYQKLPKQTLDLLSKMLRVNPDERITAEQALSHPYFKMEYQVENPHPINNSPVLSSKNSTSTYGSPQIAKTALTKDSCLEFKLGKQNVYVGKTDTVADGGKTNVSVFGKALGPGRTSKISKFSTKPPGP